MFKKLSEAEIAERNAERKAAFDALPLPEQIRLIVREELNAYEGRRQEAERERQQFPFGRLPGQIKRTA